MAKITRADLEARYELFDKFALNDQRNYYKKAVRRAKESYDSVIKIRASFALLAGLAAALAGLLVQTNFVGSGRCGEGVVEAANCGALNTGVSVLIVIAVVAPALGALFSSLADLYQWDRTRSLFEDALDNLEVADAQSPLAEMKNDLYKRSLYAYTQGTLQVMEDETAQWGQGIRTPEQITKFIEEQQKIAEQARIDRQPGDGGST